MNRKNCLKITRILRAHGYDTISLHDYETNRYHPEVYCEGTDGRGWDYREVPSVFNIEKLIDTVKAMGAKQEDLHPNSSYVEWNDMSWRT